MLAKLGFLGIVIYFTLLWRPSVKARSASALSLGPLYSSLEATGSVLSSVPLKKSLLCPQWLSTVAINSGY
ncbi:MAG: hypothetical protein OXC44_08410 [Proteobacteria bacterium]|nr:hypothetical protein [Pseudomonadota bacterium]